MKENNDKIRQLSDREKSRERVSIFFGSNSNNYHPFIELTMNGIDEINNNFDKGEINIELNNDNQTITILDSGRGIKLNGETNGVKNYELLLLKLFAGTNYENIENDRICTGCNGVGACCTVYTSKYFKITSYQYDKSYMIEFENGGNIITPLTESKVLDNKHGTEITFKLDDDVFTSVTYDINRIYDIINHMSSVNNKITFKVSYNGESKEFYYNSIEEYFDSSTDSNTCKKVVGLKKQFNIDREHDWIELVLTTSSNPIQESFLNITHLIEGGTINDGIINGVRTYVNKYCKDKKMLDKKNKGITYSDVEDSISFVCNFLTNSPEFSNQTKYSTRKDSYKKIANEYTQELLEVFKTEQPSEFEKMAKHILEVQKFNTKSEDSKKKLKSKLSDSINNITNRIEGLIDCKKHGEGAEIYIAEGEDLPLSFFPTYQ